MNLNKLIDRLDVLIRKNDGKPKFQCVFDCIRFSSATIPHNVKDPTIKVTFPGGILFEWENYNKYLSIDFRVDGKVIASFEENKVFWEGEITNDPTKSVPYLNKFPLG